MQVCDTIILAQYIVTQNDKNAILENTALVIQDGIIIDIASIAEIKQKWIAKEEVDLSNSLLMPALINTHTHVSMTYARGIADDLPLMEWLTGYIFPLDKRLNEEIVEIGATLGFAEMLRTGTGACIDMSIGEEKVLFAAEQTGIRCLGGETIFQFPSFTSQGAEATFDIVRALYEKYKNHSRIDTCVAIHSVYTTTPDLLEKCVTLAGELSLPIHMHLSETHTETTECIEQWNMRPLELCNKVGLLRKGTSFAHVVDVTEEEIKLLAKNNVSIAHNPSSNMKLASGIAPIVEMQKHNISVGLATDSSCSNNRLNLFTEMRETALLHKVSTLNPTVLSAQEVLNMATEEGAKIFAGLDTQNPKKKLGSLEIGSPADIIALKLDEPHMQPMYNPISHLVYVATGMEVHFTMIEGEILYLDGKFTRFDYNELLNECKKMRAWVLKNKM